MWYRMVDHSNGAPMASTLSYFISSCMTLMHRSLQNSTFVGFDIAEIQPRLLDLEDYNDISDRISWVNGNLFVPPFPLASLCVALSTLLASTFSHSPMIILITFGYAGQAWRYQRTRYARSIVAVSPLMTCRVQWQFFLEARLLYSPSWRNFMDLPVAGYLVCHENWWSP